MPKYAYEVKFTDFCAGVIEANNEADAEYLLERDFDEHEDVNITRLEEVID